MNANDMLQLNDCSLYGMNKASKTHIDSFSDLTFSGVDNLDGLFVYSLLMNMS